MKFLIIWASDSSDVSMILLQWKCAGFMPESESVLHLYYKHDVIKVMCQLFYILNVNV